MACRHGIDDLRLFKALEQAGLEGRVVVTDTLARADIVFTVRAKRLGPAVDLAVVRQAAGNAGVPLVVLSAVSALRVAEALEPLLGIPPPTHLQERQNNTGRELRVADLEADGGDELLRLLWDLDSSVGRAGPGRVGPSEQASPTWAARSGFGVGALAPQTGVRGRQGLDDVEGGYGSDLLAMLAADSADIRFGMDSAARGSESVPSPAIAGGSARKSREAAAAGQLAARAALLDDPFEWLAPVNVDPEDDRAAQVPRNPSARVGDQHVLLKPMRHGSKLRRRRTKRELADLEADW